MIKAIIFDLDGVLLDSERLNVYYKQKLSRKLGFNLNKKDIIQSIGLGKEEAYHYFLNLVHNDWLYPLLTDYRKKQTKLYVKRKGLPLKPYVLEVLDELASKNIKLALATSSNKEILAFYSQYFPFNKYFSCIITGDQVKLGKPHPDIFLKAADALKITPFECLVIEDSFNGLVAGKKGKFITCYVPDLWKLTVDQQVYADYQFKNLKEILYIL